MIQLESHSEEQTQQFSISLAKVVNGSCCIALEGTLGSGKTSFVQGLGRGLSVNEPVISPTFAIVHEHQGDVDLLHADLYRLEEQDLINLGLEEAFETFDGLVVVEWANLYPELLPLDHLYIVLVLLENIVE